MVGIKLIKADLNHISIISDLAYKVWHAHYPEIISMEQISYMLNLMYSNAALKEQISEKKHDFYLIESDKKNIGFISVNKLEEKDSYMLNKFYLLQDLAKKGAGTQAFKILLETIKPSQIKLTVNRKNFKSINFYFKNGFVIDSVADFDIGNGFVMEDFVMVWKVVK